MRGGTAVALTMCAFLFSSCCKNPLELIPKANANGIPPLIRGPEDTYVIIPRPYRIPQAGLDELNKLLANEKDPGLYKIVIYNEKGEPTKTIGEGTCITEAGWDIINKAAKENGGSATFAGLIGGKACFDTNLIDPRSADFVRGFDALVMKYAKR